jgi:hypothetical protein
VVSFAIGTILRAGWEDILKGFEPDREGVTGCNAYQERSSDLEGFEAVEPIVEVFVVLNTSTAFFCRDNLCREAFSKAPVVPYV